MNSEFTIAVHSLVYLAYRPDRMATSDVIARNVNTHPSRLRKVMSCLKKRGFVAAKEGIGGGFMLSCDPDKVSLAEVYAATAIGSIKPGWCSGKVDEDCMVACHMAEVMDQIFCEAEQQLMVHLRGWTINGVLERVRYLQHHPQR